MTVRPGSILNTPMVMALMAFAIVAFLLLIDTSLMPDGDKKATVNKPVNTNSALNTNPSTTTNTNSTTEGTFSTNTNAAAE